MIDLRDEMLQIIRDYGQDGLLIRNDIAQTCKCVSAITKAPDDSCPICLGEGVVSKVEKVRFRQESVSSPGMMSKYLNYTSVGNIGAVFTGFFMEFKDRPKKHDSLVVCDWTHSNANIPIINDYTYVYDIDFAEPLRADDGRIEFFFVLGKTDGVNQDIRLHNIRRNADTYEYFITLRSENV